MSSLTEEVKSDAKLLGYFDYRTTILVCVAFLCAAMIMVYFQVDDEQVLKYGVVAGFNLLCLGVTYIMRGQLDRRAAERAQEREKKAEWDKKSEAEKMAEFNKYFPVMNMSPQEAAKFMKE